MRVLFVSQLPLSLASGGLEIQITATASALAGQGVQIQFMDPWAVRLDADVLHCFGSEYQLGELIARISAAGLPLVVSSVFAPRRPVGSYLAWRLVDRLVPLKTSFGVRAGILRAADTIIALTPVEAHHVARIFGVSRDRIRMIPNGVESRFFTARSELFVADHAARDFALMVASVEPQKNQVRLVRALEGTGIFLVLIGEPSSYEQTYADELSRIIDGRQDVLWIRGLPHDSPLLASAYAAARVHVLPSLVEVQPLAALEAAAAGANLVLSDLPSLRATFARHAWFCDPRSIASIRRAVLDAYRAGRGARYAQRPEWLLSWDEVASRLVDVYQAVLSRRVRA